MASIRRTLALALRIVRQFLRDKRTMALLFVAPLVVMTILNFVLNNSGPSVTLAIVPPPGAQGAALTQSIQSALAGANGVATTVITADQVDSTLKAGDADAAIVFPQDFFTTLASGGQPRVALRLEGSNPPAANQAKQLAAFALAKASSSLSASLSGQSGATTSAIDCCTRSIPPTFMAARNIPRPTRWPPCSSASSRSSSSSCSPRSPSCASAARERWSASMVSPLSQTELTMGYVLGFTLFATIQSIVILAFVIFVLQVHYAGALWLLFLVTLLLTIGGVNMGIFASAFARNELQVIQFIPLLIVPQALLGGLFFSVKALPVVLKQLAYIMPLTWANFALKDVMLKGLGFSDIWPDLAFLVGFATLMVIAAAVSLRQERL